MAHASILVNTVNLTAPDKVGQIDRGSLDYLEAKIQMSSKDVRNRK